MRFDRNQPLTNRPMWDSLGRRLEVHGAFAALAAAPLLALLLAMTGCNGSVSASVPGDDPEVQASTGGPSFMENSVNAPWTTLFRGTRLVQLYDGSTGGSPGLQHLSVKYREDVAADGQGNFSVVTLEVLSPNPDPQTFLAIQDLRQTFSYRYRDFSIKDWNLFSQQYVYAIVDQGRSIAGHPTVQVRIDRNSGGRSYYLVDFDPVTSLVLAYQEFSVATGGLLADVSFETLTYQPDLTGLTLVSHLFPTETYSISGGNLQGIFGFTPLVPVYVPQGYQVSDTIEKQTAPDGVRAKVYLTDGLETIILASQQPITGNGGPIASRVWSTDLGTWTGLMGDVEGYPVVVAGKVDAVEQSLVLQSALH